MRLYLIRHALPDYTQAGVYHRPPGPGLTPEGLKQVEPLVSLLQGTGIRRIATSPLLRCRMTAEPVAAALNVDLETDDDLIDGQPGEKENDVTARVMRAVLNRVDTPVVALVSHAAPLEYLLKMLTRDTVQFPPKDRRGTMIREGSVYRAYLHEGRWEARVLPSDGFQA